MKATIEFETDLYRQLKSTAALRGKKVRELVNEGVRLVLAQSGSAPLSQRPFKFPLITSKRKRPLEIPHDIASRMEVEADLERHAASLR